jgi:hypothetical protein
VVCGGVWFGFVIGDFVFLCGVWWGLGVVFGWGFVGGWVGYLGVWWFCFGFVVWGLGVVLVFCGWWVDVLVVLVCCLGLG